MTSRSEPEESRITVRFRLGTDPDVAASDVRDRVSRVRGRLPEEIEEPVIAKVEADARSEEHTSELQSLMRISYAVFCLKKKKIVTITKLTIKNQHSRHRNTSTIYTPYTISNILL